MWGPLGGVLAGTRRRACASQLRAWWARSVWHLCGFVGGLGYVGGGWCCGVRPRPAAACVRVYACGGWCWCWCGCGLWDVCGGDTVRVLVMCACVRPVRVPVWRRRACEAYGAGVFCVVARAGCSVLLRRGCGGGSGEVGLVWLLCVLRAGLVVVFVLLRSVCEGGGAKVRVGVGVVGVMVVLSVGCALCGGSMRA